MALVYLEGPLFESGCDSPLYLLRAQAYLREKQLVVLCPKLQWAQDPETEHFFAPPKESEKPQLLEGYEAFRRICETVYFFLDYGWSDTMNRAYAQCVREKMHMVFVYLEQNNKEVEPATEHTVNIRLDPRIVFVEGPFSGDIQANVRFTLKAMTTLRRKGFFPFASHVQWTMHHLAPHFYVTDFDPKYQLQNCGRAVSMEQLKCIRRRCAQVLFFTERGTSSGMKEGLDHCSEEGLRHQLLDLGAAASLCL